MDLSSVKKPSQDARHRYQPPEMADEPTDDGEALPTLYDTLGLTKLTFPRTTTEEWLAQRTALSAIFT
jgi:hypothetical protein